MQVAYKQQLEYNLQALDEGVLVALSDPSYT